MQRLRVLYLYQDDERGFEWEEVAELRCRTVFLLVLFTLSVDGAMGRLAFATACQGEFGLRLGCLMQVWRVVVFL